MKSLILAVVIMISAFTQIPGSAAKDNFCRERTITWTQIGDHVPQSDVWYTLKGVVDSSYTGYHFRFTENGTVDIWATEDVEPPE